MKQNILISFGAMENFVNIFCVKKSLQKMIYSKKLDVIVG